MKRSEVKQKLALVKKAIKSIESSDEVVLYITRDKYLSGAGYISEIETISGLVRAHNEITKLNTNDCTASIAALGLSEDEIPESDVKILGFKPEHWFKDIETRLSELRKESKLKQLLKAEKSLNKHLSDDDKFELDTDGIDDLIGE